MCPSTEPANQSGGVNITGTVGSVGGDIVGRDKIGLDEESWWTYWIGGGFSNPRNKPVSSGG
jgi:hypothetical protein